MKFTIPKTIDWTLYLVPIILNIVGIVIIYSLTYFNGKVGLAYDQIVFACVGIAVMIALTFIDYRNLKGMATYAYIIGIILLVLLFFVGKSALGATRWINLGFTQLQPSELFKLCLILMLAKYLADNYEEIKLKHLLMAAFIFIVPAILVLKQPDLGTFGVLFAIALVMILATKIKIKQLILIGFVVLLGACGAWFSLRDYQKQRIETFLNPASDPYGSGYNVLQSTIAVGNGGLFGQGLGQGPQSQLNFLPVAHTDFIFAGFAEATGFAGCLILICLFVLFISRAINVARISKDSFGMFLAVGISAMFTFQMFVNIGMNIGIMPVTGIPLPFVSHGGTSLVISYAAVGILQSIYLRHKKITF